MEHVTLPSGRISESGIIAIKNLLLSKTNNYDGLPTDWAWVMQVGGKGEYVGSLPKRIAKYYWQKHNVKFDSDFLGTLGSLSAENTTKVNDFTFDIVRHFDWEAGDFGDNGSCFWSCREKARDMMLENEGQAIRFFSGEEGIARAWIMPHPSGEVCFNAYGLPLSQVAQILAFHRGKSYRKIRLSNNDTTDGLLWINSGAGFLIGEESEIHGETSHDFSIPCNCCEDCNDYCEEELTYVANGRYVCESCLENYSYCEDCEEYHRSSNHVEGDRYVCDDCFNDYSECAGCGEYCKDTTEVAGGNYVCESCLSDYTYCDDCHEYHSDTTEVRGGFYVCENCLADYTECADCGEYVKETTEVGGGNQVCDDCLENYTENEDGEYTKTEGVECCINV